jgi:mannose-6-phosphate isomerase
MRSLSERAIPIFFKMNPAKNKVFKLLGKVQHYAWGGNSFLSELLHIDNEEKKPFAEYWLGAHENASSEIIMGDDQRIKLKDYISSDPKTTLGVAVNARFRRLPYLLKILDVKEMLSIQVHPSKEIAEAEFFKENSKLIPLNAPHRNYKDDNHKPELMFALGDFWLLHGFKPKLQLTRILEQVDELNFLLPVFNKGNYYELYKTVMELDQDIVNEVLQPLLAKIIPKYLGGELEKHDEHFWAARAALTYDQPGKIDRGIFSIYLFNLVNVHPGTAVFQGAGLPHAYLEGQNVEIMANSDNVLRGGLTPKHVDVDELLRHVKFEETIPHIIPGKPIKDHLHTFFTPAEDFELAEIKLSPGDVFVHTALSVEIFLVLSGRLTLQEEENNLLSVAGGEAFIAFHEARLKMDAITESVIYRASVPLNSL